ncbi:MAG: glycosyltransferase [Lachnospiraceae bacterium]|nr:glycosyltransferase [Lachnospiraceae bacterium]
MNAPVIIFAYNRSEKLKACIDSLTSCDGHEESEVFVFSDGAKGSEDAGRVSGVREYLERLEDKHGFKSIAVEKRLENFGLARNVISGVTEIIEKYGRVIVLEDDLVVTKDFLSFMNEALDFYEPEQKIWSVTGYGIPVENAAGYGRDVYYSYRASSYGWGTWLSRWRSVDWDMKSYDRVMKDKDLRRKFERGGRDLTRILKDQHMGLVDSWAIRWCLSQSLQDRYTVYPVKSFVSNTGHDGSGTNDIKTDQDNKSLHKYGETVKLEHLSPDKKICRAFYNYYSSPGKRLLRNLNPAGIRRQIARIHSKIRTP